MHQSVRPLTGKTHPDCDLRTVIEESNIEFEIIAVGHLHKRIERTVDGCEAFCPGAMERLGASYEDPLPSVELVTIEPDEIKRERRILEAVL